MNRILSLAETTRTSKDARTVGEALFETGTDHCPWSLFIPLHYERNYAYPLLIWLHGPRDNEQQLKRIMPLVSMRNYAAIAPGDRTPDLATPGVVWRQDDAGIARAEQLVIEAIHRAGQKLNVSSRRVFLAGFDAGGTMALRIALRNPNRFAGVVSLGGPLPRDRTPLANLRQARHLPVLIATGSHSPVYREAEVCGDLRLLHSAGMNVALRLYPHGQEISPVMLGDVDRWVMELVTGSATR